MTTMTDTEIIAWARKYAAACDVTEGRGSSLAERYRRLADLAEKGAEDWQPIATAPRDVSAMFPEDRE